MPQKAKLTVVKKHFEVIQKSDQYDLLRSQGCVFQYIIRDQYIYYYLHGWYGTYGKAYITYIKMELVSDQHAAFINTLIHDYSDPEVQPLISLEDIIDNLEEDKSLRQFEETVYGQNCLMTYKLFHDKKTPAEITKIEILKDPDNRIFLKPDIRIPKLLLPGAIENSKPKKTMKQVLEETRAKRLLKKAVDNV